MKLSKGGIDIEVTGRSINVGAISMLPAEIEKAAEILSTARNMISLPVVMPINNDRFEVRFQDNRTFDFVRMGTSTTAETVYPGVSFEDFDNLILGLKEAINSHIDRAKHGGDVRVHRQTEYLSDDPGIG